MTMKIAKETMSQMLVTMKKMMTRTATEKRRERTQVATVQMIPQEMEGIQAAKELN